MPTQSDEIQKLETEGRSTDWAARSDKPPRSVFSNFKSEVVEANDLGDAKLAEGDFPLTPTLSQGERENRSPAHGKSGRGRYSTHPEQSERARMLFPLPAGEGQGEGEPAIRTLQSAIDHAIARSFVYRFIAKVFEDPTPQGWAILTDAATKTSFRTALHALAAERGGLCAGAEKLLATLTPESLEAFNDCYLVTFGHAARGPCPMNEIEYGNLKADSLFQPHRLADLNAFYRAFGLELAENAAERPDHICLELEFMSVLAAKEAYALEHQLDADQIALGRDAQKKFLREHLGHWLPAFTRRLEREAGPGALASLAEFTRHFVLSECARFGVTPGSEDLLLRPVDEAADRMCDSCGITNLPPGALATA